VAVDCSRWPPAGSELRSGPSTTTQTSVQCARKLREQFYRDDKDWTIVEGSVLDAQFMGSLGTFDIVYSWGVLHHTGEMWRALDVVDLAVRPGGQLFLAIYNDQGVVSKRWRFVKRLFCSGRAGRAVVCSVFIPYFVFEGAAVDIVNWRNPLARYTQYVSQRGMSRFHDVMDWLGGYPFEVAKPEQIIEHYLARGCRLTRLITTNGSGCNQFVLRKSDPDRDGR